MNDGQNAGATEQTTDSMADIAGTIQTSTQTANQHGSEQGSNGQGSQGHMTTEQSQTASGNNVDDFQRFVKDTGNTVSELKNQVAELRQTQDDIVNSERRKAVNIEIDSAAKQINEETGADQRMARIFLESQYREDPNFQKVWDNREENPEAYAKALKVLKPEWEAMNRNQIDPNVAANQRALQESQRTGSTIQHESLDDKLAGMNDADFMREMRRIAN